MKYKNILLIAIILLLCGCNNQNKDNNVLERTKYTKNSEIKKENLYGCWKYNAFDIYEEKDVVYTNSFRATINFGENELEYCYFYEDKDYKCEKHEYEVDGNNLIVQDHGYILNERYNMILYDSDELLSLTLSTVYKDKDFKFYLEYSKDCKIN